MPSPKFRLLPPVVFVPEEVGRQVLLWALLQHMELKELQGLPLLMSCPLRGAISHSPAVLILCSTNKWGSSGDPEKQKHPLLGAHTEPQMSCPENQGLLR